MEPNEGTATVADPTREKEVAGPPASSPGKGRRGNEVMRVGTVREDRSYNKHANPVTGSTVFDRRYWGLEGDRPQLMIKFRTYTPQGYQAIGAHGLSLPWQFVEVNDIFGEYYQRAVYEAEYVHGYRHTPRAADIDMFIVAQLYVESIVNVRTALDVFGMLEFNDAFRTLRANFVTSSKLRRLITLHEQLETIPMPNFWRNHAVSMSGIFRETPDSAPLVTFLEPAHETLGGLTFVSLVETATAGRPNADVGSRLWDRIIANAGLAVKLLRAQSGSATWDDAQRHLLDLWYMTNVPMGLPEKPRGSIRENAFMVANRLRYSALQAKYDRGAAADRLAFVPHIQTIDDKIVRPWIGSPDEYWWAGITDTYAWLNADNDRETKTGIKLGTLHAAGQEDENVDFTWWYTREDGWKRSDWFIDVGDSDGVNIVMGTPDLRRHVWLSEFLTATVQAYGESDPSVYGSGHENVMEHDLEDIADGFRMKMFDALDLTVD